MEDEQEENKEEQEEDNEEEQEEENEEPQDKPEPSPIKPVDTIKTVKKSFNKIPTHNWAIMTYILGILSILLLITYFTAGGGLTGKAISQNEAKTLIENFINDELIPTGGATVESIDSESGLYKANVNLDGEIIPLYFTKDGNWVGQGQELKTITGNAISGQSTPSAPQELPKSDKPKVELFVMSFCPYGVQAEDIMKPVYDLLKDKVDFNIRFIISVGGDTLASANSLHGPPEAEEDARQLCIAKKYPNKLWDYVSEINKNCYPTYREDGALDKCWKEAAQKVGIPVSEIDTCSKSSEGVNLLKQDEETSNENQVSGSPTLIINGQKFQGGRSSEAYQAAICSAFNDAPEECGEIVELSQEQTAKAAQTGAVGNC